MSFVLNFGNGSLLARSSLGDRKKPFAKRAVTSYTTPLISYKVKAKCTNLQLGK